MEVEEDFMADWGSVPLWVGTVFTCVSVAVAVATYLRATFDKERDQAAKVGAWVIGGAEEWAEYPEGSGHYEGKVDVRIYIANRSDAPIYDIALKWRMPEDRGEPVPKDRRFEEIKQPELAPGITAYKPLTLPLVKDTDPAEVTALLGQPLWTKFAVPEIKFTDALGRTWVRTSERRIRRARRWEDPRDTYLAIPVERGPSPVPYR